MGQNMTQVRALCPATCGCAHPYPNQGGFYQTEEWGCPPSCTRVQAFTMNFYSSNCIDDMDGWIDRRGSDHWKRYVYGLKDYVFNIGGYAQRISYTLAVRFAMFNIKRENISAMYDYLVVNDGFWIALANLRFTVMDGVYHPRNLTYCDFLTSYEIRILLLVDVCEEGRSFTS